MPEPNLFVLRARCARALSYHTKSADSPAVMLRRLAEMAGDALVRDAYGEGELIEGFTREVAALLGKEASVFMPSGTMAQQIALRIWADRAGSRNVVFHPLCHLEVHEQKAYRHLHGLHGITAGSAHGLLTVEDLGAVRERAAALLLELPQREIGGRLPPWDDLVKLAAAAREKGMSLHMDGARLWECGPFYGRPYAEIAGLFDSVYVSFYKGIGGIAGCALAGTASFVEEAKVWQRRHGGDVVSMYPEILSAKLGLAERLPKMPEYAAKARAVAARLSRLPGVEVVPDPPCTNMMHVYFEGVKEKLEAAALAIAEERSVWLFGKLRPSPLPSRWLLEIAVGDATLELSDDEIGALFEEVLARARG